MQGFNRWAAISLAMVAVLMAVGIGAGAYQAGVAHGLALQIPAATTPEAAAPYYYYGYGCHRPWGFGIFFPFFFVFLWLVVLRGIFGGGRRRWHYYRHGDEMPSRFDEWHRRAHEQMRPDASSPTHL
jgi:hypothetical protein